MNRTYKLYLQQKILSYSKKVILLYIPLLLTIFILYYIKSSYDEKQAGEQKQREVLMITSSKTVAVSASRENVEKTFETLSTVRKENKQFDRQYVIETLTFYAQSSNLLNFVIDSVAEKPQLIESSYKSLSKIANIVVFEAQISFDTIMSKEMSEFLDNLNRNINGIAVIQKLEIKRNIQEIDQSILHALNTGQKVPLLGNKIVIHWFFVKNI